MAIVAALMPVVLAAPAQAANSQRTTSPPYRPGTFAGQVAQRAPRSFTGKIQFTVRRGALSALNFTAGALCGGLWVTELDSLPQLTIPIGSHGGFFFDGTIHGRQIRLYGTLKGDRATGKLFQSFMWGNVPCSMGQAASFTATS